MIHRLQRIVHCFLGIRGFSVGIDDMLPMVSVQQEITNAYSDNPELSPDYTRIVNTRNWERLKGLIEPEKILFGGQIIGQNYQ